MFRIASDFLTTSKPENSEAKMTDATATIFKDFHIYILPNGMGKNRVELFKNAVCKNGGSLIDENKQFDSSIELSELLIIIDEFSIQTLDGLNKILSKKKFYSSLQKSSSTMNDKKIKILSSA